MYICIHNGFNANLEERAKCARVYFGLIAAHIFTRNYNRRCKGACLMTLKSCIICTALKRMTFKTIQTLTDFAYCMFRVN